jgi:enoyl-CoA hydratase/carnithine racemase
MTAIVRRDLLGLAVISIGAAATARAEPTAGLAVERRPDGILLIGIDRPQAQNRIDVETFRALGRAYFAFEQDRQLRVAVLHARGPDFSLGLDAASWAAALAGGAFPTVPDFLDPLATTGPRRTKPLVVAVQGRVTRIAHELFLAADIRVAAEDAVFNQGEALAGAFPAGGATVRFVREAGWGNAMRYMLTGDDWTAGDALRMGLVQAVTAPGRQLERAVEIASRVATAAPLGVRAVLASAHRAVSDGETPALAALGPEFVRLLRSEDRQEYLRALRESRPPVFVGR